MGEAARLVDAIAHRHAGGRWLATGGGGYDAYRVVPRSWSLVWLAGAHREVPSATPADWRERWAAEGERYGQAPLPETFDRSAERRASRSTRRQVAAETRSRETTALVRELMVPRLLREASRPRLVGPGRDAGGVRGVARRAEPAVGEPTVVPSLDAGGVVRVLARPARRRTVRSPTSGTG